jgi:hypothetical protein
MSKRSLREVVSDPRWISSIYNYCDRWCERCALTSRCIVFARTSAEREPADFKALARRMHEDFAETITMLEEKANELGIDLSAAPDPADEAEAQAVQETIEKHPLRQAAGEYVRMAGAWLAAHASDRNDHHKRPAPARDKRPREGAAPLLSADEAITIIGWHHYQIAAKLTRALSFDPADAQYEDDPVQTDANGSARVALLAIERSLDAWFELLHFNHDTLAIMRILEHLNALRGDVDRVFPDARKFVRPGFDTGEQPWPESQEC